MNLLLLFKATLYSSVLHVVTNHANLEDTSTVTVF